LEHYLGLRKLGKVQEDERKNIGKERNQPEFSKGKEDWKERRLPRSKRGRNSRIRGEIRFRPGEKSCWLRRENSATAGTGGSLREGQGGGKRSTEKTRGRRKEILGRTARAVQPENGGQTPEKEKVDSSR